MKACWCILGGTKACDSCVNGPSTGTGQNPLSYGYEFNKVSNFEPRDTDADYLDRCAIAAMAALIMRHGYELHYHVTAKDAYEQADKMLAEKKRREGK